mmetsp:Transcript_127335/g.189852  ORF Transcript_127335/g.189852 Transcript_127335/m.189852 type:complete len:246 (-) Transcript_127335:4043-4780(-)
MFQSQYSNDVSVFAIDGRILQLEYAQNASKYGQTVLGMRSEKHSVLFSFYPQKKAFVSKMNKIFTISKNSGMAVTGIIGDGKSVHRFIENKNEQYKYAYKINCPVSSLALNCSSLFHRSTFHSGARPYGTTVLMSGYDSNGISLVEISTDGTSIETYGTIIGSDSQTMAGKLSDRLEETQEYSLDELIVLSIEIFHKKILKKDSIKSGEKNFQIGLNGKALEFSILNPKCQIYYMTIFKRKKLKE